MKEVAKFKEIVNSHELVLIDFFAEWCGPCKGMVPVLQDLKEDLDETIRIVKVDTDKHQQVSAQYQIRSIPTLILFKNGKQVWKQAGALSLPQLKQVIKQYQ